MSLWSLYGSKDASREGSWWYPWHYCLCSAQIHHNPLMSLSCPELQRTFREIRTRRLRFVNPLLFCFCDEFSHLGNTCQAEFARRLFRLAQQEYHSRYECLSHREIRYVLLAVPVLSGFEEFATPMKQLMARMCRISLAYNECPLLEIYSRLRRRLNG